MSFDPLHTAQSLQSRETSYMYTWAVYMYVYLYIYLLLNATSCLSEFLLR